MQYDVKLTPDSNDTLLVTSPDFPELTTFGEDEVHALEMAADALEEALAARAKRREPIPQPRSSTRRGHHRVAVDAMIEAKIRLHWQMQEQGLNKAQLARRLSVKAPQIDRLLDLRYHSHWSQLKAAAAALGKRMTIQLRDVA